MKKCSVIFFGDSICVGEGVAVHEGWVPRLSQDCQRLNNTKKYKDVDVIVSNCSVSGDTTRTALLRMPYHVQNKNPDIVIIQFGLNDCNRWDTESGVNRVSEGSYFYNLLEMIDRATRAGAKRVYLLTNHSTYKNLEYNARVLSYNTRIRMAGNRYTDKRVQVIDVEEEFRHRRVRGVLSDGIHLNKRGHKVYYNAVRQKLLKGIKSELS